MSKGLEALKEIIILKHLYCVARFKNEVQQEIDVEKAYEEKIKTIEKELKVLEIIINNCEYWDFTELFCGIKENNSYEDYLECCKATNETKYATKEEYDLLKKVLL